MAKILKIGGPGLDQTQHTWIEHPTSGAIKQLKFGAEVPYEDAGNADDLVQRGLATVIEKSANKPGSSATTT